MMTSNADHDSAPYEAWRTRHSPSRGVQLLVALIVGIAVGCVFVGIAWVRA